MDRTLNVSESDLLAELEAMLVPARGGMTTAEVAAALAITEYMALKKIKELDALGRIEHVKKQVPKFGGGTLTTGAYRLKVEGDRE